MNKPAAAYMKLVTAFGDAPADPKVTAALEAFEPLFFSNMVSHCGTASLSAPLSRGGGELWRGC